jgi:Transposase DDE domain group 1
MTECTQSVFEFAGLYQRQVVAQFDGGDITTDAGGLLLREVDGKLNLIARLAGCFVDHRRPDRTEHGVRELVAQRVYGLALGYEDLNDHDQLRADPLMAVLVGKAEPKGGDRRRGSRIAAKPARARAR